MKNFLNNLKEKVKNYGFWISLCSAVMLVISNFGLEIDVPYVEEIISSILGVLVILGVISNPKEGKGYIDSTNKSESSVIENTRSIYRQFAEIIPAASDCPAGSHGKGAAACGELLQSIFVYSRNLSTGIN